MALKISFLSGSQSLEKFELLEKLWIFLYGLKECKTVLKESKKQTKNPQNICKLKDDLQKPLTVN